MDKVANLFLAGIALFLAGLFGYWWQEDNHPVEFKRTFAVTPKVTAGGAAIVQYDIFRHRNDCRTHVERQLFDGDDVRHPVIDDDFTVNPGDLGDDVVKERILVPADAAPGAARYRAIRTYYCNPIQIWFDKPIVVRRPDIEFEIVPAQP